MMQETVMVILRQFDEEGVRRRKKNKLKRRVYLSKVKLNIMCMLNVSATYVTIGTQFRLAHRWL